MTFVFVVVQVGHHEHQELICICTSKANLKIQLKKYISKVKNTKIPCLTIYINHVNLDKLVNLEMYELFHPCGFMDFREEQPFFFGLDDLKEYVRNDCDTDVYLNGSLTAYWAFSGDHDFIDGEEDNVREKRLAKLWSDLKKNNPDKVLEYQAEADARNAEDAAKDAKDTVSDSEVSDWDSEEDEDEDEDEDSEEDEDEDEDEDSEDKDEDEVSEDKEEDES